MPPPVSRLGVVRFGIFEADFRAGELRRAGARIELHDQPFQVLAMLLDRPGELVNRDELRKRLWPGDTFVDFDHGLNNAVARLREALGDSADNPRFIETLPRRGYRLITPANLAVQARPGAACFGGVARGAKESSQVLPARAKNSGDHRSVSSCNCDRHRCRGISPAAGITIEIVTSFGNIATFDDECTRELGHHFCDISGWQVPGIFRQNRSILASPLYG